MAGGEILTSEKALKNLVEEAEWARSRNMEVAVAAIPAAAWLNQLPDLDALGEKMKELHWTLAVKVAPRILVLWWEPIWLGTEWLPARPPLDRWLRQIRKCSEDIKAGFPDLLTSVCIGSTEKEGQQLFTALAAADFPLDRPGFTAAPFLWNRQKLEQWLQHMANWIQGTGTAKPCFILRTGASPPAVGGERGQEAVIALVLEWARTNKSITRICIHSLRGYTEDLGLVTPQGRRRAAFGLVR
jgi:hypothetical protein